MAAWTGSYPVRFGEIDHAGVMYYPALFDRVHRAFEDFWPQVTGRSLATLIEGGLGLPLRDVQARFVQPFRFGETVRVEVELVSAGTTSLVFRCRLFGGRGEEPRVEATLTNVAVDMATFQPTPVPAFVLDALAPFAQEADPT